MTGWKRLYLRDPHLGVDLVEEQSLRDGIEALIAKVGPYQSRVLLLDEPVVVLVERAAAGGMDTLDSIVSGADGVPVEELAARYLGGSR